MDMKHDIIYLLFSSSLVRIYTRNTVTKLYMPTCLLNCTHFTITIGRKSPENSIWEPANDRPGLVSETFFQPKIYSLKLKYLILNTIIIITNSIEKVLIVLVNLLKEFHGKYKKWINIEQENMKTSFANKRR